MSVFDGLIGNWIQIKDDCNNLTMEDYGYDTGVVEGTTGSHCVKCVTVNQCFFKNENGKKPEKFNYKGVNLLDSIKNGSFPGLYHYGCHCEEKLVDIKSVDDIQLVIPPGKVDWLFMDKSGWINSMGYEADDDFTEILYKKIKEAYFYGAYKIQSHTKFGVKIKLKISIIGKGIKEGKVYDLKSSFMVFPNGKLKCNTLIGGWWKGEVFR